MTNESLSCSFLIILFLFHEISSLCQISKESIEETRNMSLVLDNFGRLDFETTAINILTLNMFHFFSCLLELGVHLAFEFFLIHFCVDLIGVINRDLISQIQECLWKFFFIEKSGFDITLHLNKHRWVNFKSTDLFLAIGVQYIEK